MLKAMPKVFYQYMEKPMDLTGLYNYIYKRPRDYQDLWQALGYRGFR
jgi:hypothetical protein